MLAGNIMFCDQCDKRHYRNLVKRSMKFARYCDRCTNYHPAKEGDVWAESRLLGFLWRYYTVMDGRVYEITDWMKCHMKLYAHIKANDHLVTTRLTHVVRTPRHHNNGNRDEKPEQLTNRRPNHGNGSVRQALTAELYLL